MKVKVNKANYKKLSELLNDHKFQLTINELNDNEYEATLTEAGKVLASVQSLFTREKDKSKRIKNTVDDMVANFNWNAAVSENYKLTFDEENFEFI